MMAAIGTALANYGGFAIGQILLKVICGITV